MMSKAICRCCGGMMTAISSRNPNICVSCEQLLDDDCAELEKLIASTWVPPSSATRHDVSAGDHDHDPMEGFYEALKTAS